MKFVKIVKLCINSAIPSYKMFKSINAMNQIRNSEWVFEIFQIFSSCAEGSTCSLLFRQGWTCPDMGKVKNLGKKKQPLVFSKRED